MVLVLLIFITKAKDSSRIHEKGGVLFFCVYLGLKHIGHIDLN
jgi:hypothetical protein